MLPIRTFFFPTVQVAALFLLIAFSGCRSNARAPQGGTFVGRVDGTEAFVAVSRVGDAVVAYVCDGHDTATWFRGTARGRTLRLDAGDARLRLAFDADGVAGAFTPPGGAEHAFAAETATSGAGFYRASRTVADLSYVGGWVLLSGGTQRGAVHRGSAVLGGEAFALDPARPTVALPDGATLTARPVEAFLAPAAAPAADARQ